MSLLINQINRHIGKILFVCFAVLFVPHFISLTDLSSKLTPNQIYNFNLVMTYEGESDVSITTYVPEENERQKILNEQIINNGLEYILTDDKSGKIANWSGNSKSQQAAYRYTILAQSLAFELSPELVIPNAYPEELNEYLQSTDAVQVNHPEIKALWQLIKPNDSKNMVDVLSAIYQYTYQEIKGAPFKGMTDAITALRLKTASCNGKSRLFIALARYNNIPARLIGGVIMNGITKKTSHQWLEVYIEGQWVPFGPTNGNFAKLPQNYLELYKGDQSLFRHTSDINFDYIFSSDANLVAPAVYLHQEQSDQTSSVDITGLLLSMGLDPKTIGLFLLFPICTLLITFLRNIIGIKTFGIFLPMLIGAACIYTGFLKGIVGFLVILSISFIAHHLLDKMKLLKIPRLAAIITINTMVFVTGLILIGASSRLEFGMLSLFPVIIISFVAEKMHKISEEGDWLELVKRVTGTLFSIGGCYLLLNSFVLQGMFSFFPECFLLVLAAQIYIGKWTGIRLSELIRFKDILGNNQFPVIGINGRNREFVYELNSKEMLNLAADKLQTKEKLRELNIPIPETICRVKKLADIDKITRSILRKKGFALKPNKGSQGNGIIIIRSYNEGVFYGTGDKLYSIEDIKLHCSEIISGTYSQSGDSDIAYFEPLIEQHKSLQDVAPYGLSDIRVILCKGKVISAMLRMPTLGSSGKANLHQGAIGVGVDIDTGKTITAKANKQPVTKHPDNDKEVIGIAIPFWSEILEICVKCYQAVPLGYIGIDICLDKNNGPLVLEVNGRPGIEIQNIQERGFYYELSQQ